MFDGGDCCLPLVHPFMRYLHSIPIPNSAESEKQGPTRCVAIDYAQNVRPNIIGTVKLYVLMLFNERYASLEFVR